MIAKSYYSILYLKIAKQILRFLIKNNKKVVNICNYKSKYKYKKENNTKMFAKNL